MKKIILFYNPNSGQHLFKVHLDWVIAEFKKHQIWCLLFRLDEYSQSKVYKQIKDMKFDMVAVSGGDGTLNFIVSLLIKNKINVPIGIIPSGTCNDFASNLGISNSIEQAVKIICKQSVVHLDVGSINNKKYFLSTCAGGSFAEVSFNTHSQLKKNLGRLAYLMNAVTEIKNINPFTIKVLTDEEEFELEAILFIVLNGVQGGGFQNLIKDTDLADGLMDIAFLKKVNTIDLASVLIQVLAGEPINNPGVKIVRTNTCHIQLLKNKERAIKTTIDGEKGPKLPLEIKFLHKKLKFFV